MPLPFVHYERQAKRFDVTMDKFTLHKDGESEKWRLEKEGADRAKRVFDTKSEALKGLRAALGPAGGSVRIRKTDNSIQEERTYPRAKDPKKTPG